MAKQTNTINMALFCDFENIAIGVRKSKHTDFDIKRVIERLLLKGSIVVKKAYCDWDQYKESKPVMHEAAFELIEIPHIRMSGKNSADIRMVVDALDLCYTKPHVDTFVILSGDSDFSPLVSKLRENDKVVIGVGVKDSTSDLLTANCDEFIYYDDLVRKREPAKRRRRGGAPKKQEPASAASAGRPLEKDEDERVREAMDLIIGTVRALAEERGDEETVWGSMVKQTIKRRKPYFNESYYGFGTFGELLEEAERRGLVELKHDERSGGYTVKAAYSEE